MASGNAERQARWREKRNALANEARALRNAPGNPERIIEFCRNAAALVDELKVEGEKGLASFSPSTVRRLTTLLERQLEALRTDVDLPDVRNLR